MDQTTVAHIISFLGGLFVFAGVTGITSQDLTGFANVVGALASLGGVIWAFISHKKAVAATA